MEALNGMNALTLVFVALCLFAIAYRFYGLFMADKVLRLKDERATPAVKYADGRDYVSTNKNVLFGHHFAAIAAAGPLIGPVLAAQFGFLPGALWILIGCVLAGATHDMVILFASVRHKGHSLGNIVSREIGPATGVVTGLAVFFILLLGLVGLALACINALHHAPWSLFTVFITIPIAVLMGFIMKSGTGRVGLASVVGLVLLLAGIIGGHFLMRPELLGEIFNIERNTLVFALPLYGFIASVLPVWMLLAPRDYLSTYLKIGTVLMLAVGIIFVHPNLQMPPVTKFFSGGGPIIGGPALPFLFITIACGAVSGFHAIIASGTTPKMLGREREALFVGYGAMLAEGFVAIMALIAACAMMPGDYFAINTPGAAYPALLAASPELAEVNLGYFSEQIGINLHDRTGGAVSLAVGMAYIFHNIPYMEELLGYWYNFAIMFEAVFILAAVDGVTRVGRIAIQESIGLLLPRFKDKSWLPGIITASALFSVFWGYLAYTGTIMAIWPLFGISNQLLGACALIVGTTMLLRLDRGKYCLCTAIPGVALACITFWAGFLQVSQSYIPRGQYLLAGMAILLMALMAFVFISAFRKWMELLRIKVTLKDEYGEPVKLLAQE
jgi:carbon starvation protein